MHLTDYQTIHHRNSSMKIQELKLFKKLKQNKNFNTCEVRVHFR